MANEEYLKILKQGVEVWNQWRQREADTYQRSMTAYVTERFLREDLGSDKFQEALKEWSRQNRIRIDLKDADFHGANLNRANLHDVDLARADFSDTDLREADLTETNLRSANLIRAALTDANLNRANLIDANLCQADLCDANLYTATLIKANLSRASLAGTFFRKADLSRADLGSANLLYANLSEAFLVGADLKKADLSGANLSGADLQAADFAGSTIGATTFANVDLSEVVGLETAKHQQPSSIGIDTIYRSKGKIPEVFLRGAGVPENLIEYMHSLVGTAFEYYSCFISYSAKDQEFADRLYADLQTKGVRCWFAPKDLKIGDKFRQRIDEAIHVQDKLVAVLSESSVKSVWVEKEVETAFEKEKRQNRMVLFPIRLDDAVMETNEAWAADIRRTRHIGDFCHWKNHDSYKNAFERFMRDLKAEDKLKSMQK